MHSFYNIHDLLQLPNTALSLINCHVKNPPSTKSMPQDINEFLTICQSLKISFLSNTLQQKPKPFDPTPGLCSSLTLSDFNVSLKLLKSSIDGCPSHNRLHQPTMSVPKPVPILWPTFNET